MTKKLTTGDWVRLAQMCSRDTERKNLHHIWYDSAERLLVAADGPRLATLPATLGETSGTCHGGPQKVAKKELGKTLDTASIDIRPEYAGYFPDYPQAIPADTVPLLTDVDPHKWLGGVTTRKNGPTWGVRLREGGDVAVLPVSLIRSAEGQVTIDLRYFLDALEFVSGAIGASTTIVATKSDGGLDPFKPVVISAGEHRAVIMPIR